MEYKEFERLILNGLNISEMDRSLLDHTIREIYDNARGKELSEKSVRPILTAFNGGYSIATLVERTANLKRFS